MFCMCPHYSVVMRHHYSCFDHYSDCFLCEPLTAVIIRELFVTCVRMAFYSRPAFFLETQGSSITSIEILDIVSKTNNANKMSALYPFETR